MIYYDLFVSGEWWRKVIFVVGVGVIRVILVGISVICLLW